MRGRPLRDLFVRGMSQAGLPESEVSAAQISALARFTPINAVATAIVSIITGLILWPGAPDFWVAIWTLLLA